MNSSISTFLKIAVTVVSISAFLFIVGYGMIKTESTSYKGKVEAVKTNIPTGTTP